VRRAREVLPLVVIPSATSRTSSSVCKENKLNPFYEPLHTHDSLNLLCRIVGMSARYKAGQELEG
jgi:hypothetical protein